MKILFSTKPLLPFALVGLLVASGCKNNQPQPSEAQNQQGNSATQPSPAQSAEAPAPAPAPAPAAESAAPAPAAAPAPEAAPAPRAAPRPVSYTIPAGTRLSVALSQEISSKTAKSGDAFNATVQSPVVVHGKTLIRSGAAASGHIVDASAQGRIKGAAGLTLRLDSVNASGQDVAIDTSAYSREQKGKGKRSAEFIGGGGGLGALIGGLAGGGKGALIGGLAGAGAGTAGGVFTGNKQIVLPAETVLTFTLRNSVTVR